VVSFAYDLERYAGQERGLFYDLEQVLPGPVCRTFTQLATALDGLFGERARWQEDYAWKRGLFFDHLDDDNAWRVLKAVKHLYVEAEAV
jgi:CDP-glycerol glycerophosphotransferase (TagB/SpsB family)